MMRVGSRIRKAVQKRLSPVVPALIVALIAAAVVTAVAVVAGLVAYVPAAAVPLVGWTVPPRVFLFSVVFVLAAVVGLGYLAYRRYDEMLVEQWEQLSIWAQATIAGAVSGALVAFGLGVATLAGLVPPAFVLAGFIVAWPVATVLALRQGRESDPAADDSAALESILVRIGYAQIKRLQTRTLACIVGFVGAVGGALAIRSLVSWLGWSLSLLQTVALVAVLWVVATVLVYNRYESTISEREDLTIVGVSTPESQDARELTLKNDGVTPAELANAKIRDTKRDLYQFDVGVTLEPGETRSFEVPESFSLEPNDTARELPLGYTLKQGGECPIVYTRRGDQFELRDGTGAVDPDVEQPTTQSTVGLGAEPAAQE